MTPTKNEVALELDGAASFVGQLHNGVVSSSSHPTYTAR